MVGNISPHLALRSTAQPEPSPNPSGRLMGPSGATAEWPDRSHERQPLIDPTGPADVFLSAPDNWQDELARDKPQRVCV